MSATKTQEEQTEESKELKKKGARLSRPLEIETGEEESEGSPKLNKDEDKVDNNDTVSNPSWNMF
jgi:hypothetical protein